MKSDTKNTALVVAGGLVGLYVLSKSGFLEGAIEGAVSGGTTEVFDRIKEFFSELVTKETTPGEAALIPDWLQNFIAGLGRAPGEDPDLGAEGTEGEGKEGGEGGGGFELVDDVPPGPSGSEAGFTPAGIFVTRAGLAATRFGLGTAVTGVKVPFQPFGGRLAATKAGPRAVSWLTKTKTLPSVVEFLTEQAAKGADRFTAEVAAKGKFGIKPLAASRAAEGIAWKIGPKFALKGTGAIARRAAYAVPVAGWALLVVDLGADLARAFGADVTEWLGFSSLAEPFLGYNPLEKWSPLRFPGVIQASAAPLVGSYAGVNPQFRNFVSQEKPMAGYYPSTEWGGMRHPPAAKTVDTSNMFYRHPSEGW